MVLNGPDEKPSLATSFFIKCQSQAEIDHDWNALGADRQPIQCGWLKDKYGVAWQIAPEELPNMLKDKDSAKATRVVLADGRDGEARLGGFGAGLRRQGIAIRAVAPMSLTSNARLRPRREPGPFVGKLPRDDTALVRTCKS